MIAGGKKRKKKKEKGKRKRKEDHIKDGSTMDFQEIRQQCQP